MEPIRSLIFRWLLSWSGRIGNTVYKIKSFTKVMWVFIVNIKGGHCLSSVTQWFLAIVIVRDVSIVFSNSFYSRARQSN